MRPARNALGFLPLAAALSWTLPAWADPLSPPSPTVMPTAPMVISADELAQLSGGKEPAAIYALTSGVSSGNTITANTVTSGSISVSPGALDFSGIGNFVWNTGQNNVLQGVLNVFVNITPNP